MPNYRYKAKSEHPDCNCEGYFEIFQALSDDALTACPDCTCPVQRVIGRVQCMTNRRWNTKKMLSDGNLKKLGFKKLVKEGDGKYRDVLRD